MTPRTLRSTPAHSPGVPLPFRKRQDDGKSTHTTRDALLPLDGIPEDLHDHYTALSAHIAGQHPHLTRVVASGLDRTRGSLALKLSGDADGAPGYVLTLAVSDLENAAQVDSMVHLERTWIRLTAAGPYLTVTAISEGWQYSVTGIPATPNTTP